MTVVDDLADAYGWAMTTTERLNLAAALQPYDRVVVSETAAAVNRLCLSQNRGFTAADLTAALRARTHPTPEPAAVGRISERHQVIGRAGIAAARAALNPKPGGHTT